MSKRSRSARRRPFELPGRLGWRVDLVIAAGLVLSVAVAYVQVAGFEFVNYDDTVYVPDNPQVRDGFSLGGVGWACTTFETANWYPLSWLSLMLDCQIFGRNRPGGHHAVNAALHAANALLLFIVLRRMTGFRWRSAAVAALFAAHPLHVESVAWIAERKDVLSTLFFLLTLLAYHRYASQPTLGRWLLVFLSMSLGVMAKSMLVTLPFVLLLLDFWPLGRSLLPGGTLVRRSSREPDGLRLIQDAKVPLCKRDLLLILEKLPLLLLSLAIAAVTIFAQASKGATAMLDERASLTIRLANAAIAYVKYLAKIVWPFDLAVYYPYDFHPSPWIAGGAALLVLSPTVAAVWCIFQSSRHTPSAVRPAAPAAGSIQKPEAGHHVLMVGGRHTERACYLAVDWLWYVGTLVPVIGLVQVGSQAMADRYAYIPSIGIYLAFVWAVADGASRLPWPAIRSRRTGMLAATASAVLASLLIATHRQAAYWINSEQLFRHALAVTGDNPVACENLGDSLLHQERFAEAGDQFRKVLKMDAAHFQQTPPELAQALEGQGRICDVVAIMDESITDDSAKAIAMNKLALSLATAQRSHVPEAIGLLQEAIKLAPQQPMPLRNLAWIFATCPDKNFRNGAKAVDLARRACELSDWKNAVCRQTLADAYTEAGDPKRARKERQAAVELGSTHNETSQPQGP